MPEPEEPSAGPYPANGADPFGFHPFGSDPGETDTPGATPAEEDLHLAALVTQRLRTDWETSRQPIAVTAQNRVVILTGAVTDSEVRRVAGELAWGVPGVHDVCNALFPRPHQRGR
ncbi:hypothetical protein CIK06_15890 [Plantactinospora sp. KBS50]|nr:BON domain-containing protein [Plantactinospora sp. KBS50]ASW57752.1 hypothetical protein CIK06_15890 [Plantactinospora sp. KBS50]